MTNYDSVYGQVIRALRDYENAKRRLVAAKDNLNRLTAMGPSSWIQPEGGWREAVLKEYSDAKKALDELGAE